MVDVVSVWATRGISVAVSSIFGLSPAGEVAVDGYEVSFLDAEEVPDDVLGHVAVEVLAGEDVH